MIFCSGLFRQCLGIVLILLVPAGATFAREEPPPNLDPAKKLAWFEAQCTKLTAEVDDLELRRLEYKELEDAGTRLSNRIRLPSGKLMYHELQALDRERNQYPADRERARAYNAMHDDYTGRMTALIPEERDLTRRGIRNFAELKARHQAAKAAWGPVENRYPLARSERDGACQERDRAWKAVHQPPPASEDGLSHCEGRPRGKIRNPRGKVEVYAAAFRKWKGPVTAEFLVWPGDRVRTGPNSSCKVAIFTSTGIPDTLDVVSETLVEIPDCISHTLTLFDGLFRAQHVNVNRVPPPDEANPFNVRTPTVVGGTSDRQRGDSVGPRALVRSDKPGTGGWVIQTGNIRAEIKGTDLVVRRNKAANETSVMVREGVVNVRSGSIVKEVRAGQQVSAKRDTLSAVTTYKHGAWENLLAKHRIDAESATRVPNGAGTILSPPTAKPSARAPEAPSPSTSGRERDLTRRDLPSGPLAQGGETRYDGTTYSVQSAPKLNTMTEMGTGALGNFRAGAEVNLGGGGQEIAGLYVSASGDPKGRPGDIFFGVHRSGLVLQHKVTDGWRDLPRQARDPAASVRLEIERRQDRYEFRWNGEKVGEFTGNTEPKRVAMYAGEGVKAQFRKFQVTSW